MSREARPRKSPKPPRSRTMVLLISCGLWLLYFDLLTSMPGCTSKDETAGRDTSQVDARAAGADSNAPSATDSATTIPTDAPTTPEDAPSGDAPNDAQLDGGVLADADPLDASAVDAAGVDSSSVDSSSVDSSSVDSSINVDASIPVDAAPDA